MKKILIIPLMAFVASCAQTPTYKIELHDHIHLGEFPPNVFRTVTKLGYGAFCDNGNIITNEDVDKLVINKRLRTQKLIALVD